MPGNVDHRSLGWTSPRLVQPLASGRSPLAISLVAAIGVLGDDGYRQMVKGGLARLAARLPGPCQCGASSGGIG